MGVPYAPKIREWPTGDSIHFMFGFRVGFQGRRIEWRYFRLHQIQVGGRPPSWIISNYHIYATTHSIHLYSAHRAVAHRAVIFVIAQLSYISRCATGFTGRWTVTKTTRHTLQHTYHVLQSTRKKAIFVHRWRVADSVDFRLLMKTFHISITILHRYKHVATVVESSFK